MIRLGLKKNNVLEIIRIDWRNLFIFANWN